jgi:hypothetical protein
MVEVDGLLYETAFGELGAVLGHPRANGHTQLDRQPLHAPNLANADDRENNLHGLPPPLTPS